MERNTAERLAALRREHGYSQEELAEKLGVSRQAVSKWERAESSPDTDNLVALARLYGTSLDSLAGIEAPSAGAQDPGDKAAGHDPAPTPSRKTKIIIAALIILALIEAAGLIYLIRPLPGSCYVRGTVVATEPSWDQFVISTNDQWTGESGQIFYVLETSEDTFYRDKDDNVIDPTWMRIGWEVEVMYPSNERSVGSDRLVVRGVKVLDTSNEADQPF